MALRFLIRHVLGVPTSGKMPTSDVLELPNRPEHSRQQMLRDNYIIEWLLGIIQLGWTSEHLFNEEPELVQRVAEVVTESELPEGKIAELNPLFTVLQLAHNLLKRLLTSNHTNALVVNEMDVSEQLLGAFKTAWRPAVTEYYGSLLSASREEREFADATASGDESGTKLWKSDLYVLVNQIHSDLVRKGEYNYRMLDFLASVCSSGGRVRARRPSNPWRLRCPCQCLPRAKTRGG